MSSFFLRLPTCDIWATTLTHQSMDPCSDFEMRLVECMEAYGFPRCRRLCQDYFSDLQECSLKHKQKARVEAIRKERARQVKAGERKPEDKWSPPPKPYIY